MSRYIVVSDFIDMQDGDHYYAEGDNYPRDGAKPTKERINMLLTTNNKHKKALIKKGRKKNVRPASNVEE